MRSSIFLFSLTILLGILPAEKGLAQEFNFRNFSVGDGLGQSQVFAMIQDSRGYLWMGTRGGGLSRFDGHSFTTYTVRDGLVSNFILSLYEDEKHNIWIGTDNGLSRFNGLAFENHKLGEEGRFFMVGSITQDLSGTLYFGTNNGIYTLGKKDFEHYSSEEKFNSGNITALYTDPKGTVWAGHNRGLTRLEKGNVQTFGRKEGLRSDEVRCIGAGSKGIWVGSSGGGLHFFDGEKFDQIRVDGPGEAGIVLSILEDKDQQVWAATATSGIFRWNSVDSTSIFIGEKEGLANNHVRTIMQDAWGNLWFGTSGGGLSRYIGQQFSQFTTRNGLPGNYIFSVFEDSRSNLWLGTSGLGVTKYDGKDFHTYNADSGFHDVKVKTIFEDCDGQIWFGTEGKGLSFFDGKKFKHLTGYHGLSGNWIRDIAQDADDNMWVATIGGGITKMIPDKSTKRGFRFTHFRASDGLPKDRINCLHIDKWSRIWFGTISAGIGFIKDDSIHVFPNNDKLSNGRIRSMDEDQNGHLWVGTAEGGVNRIQLYDESDSITVFDVEGGLTSNNVYQLQVDHQQNLWVGSETGVDKLSFGAEHQLLEVAHYGREEGFSGIETAQNAISTDWKGNLWFGTIDGLIRCNPGDQNKNTVAPLVRITALTLSFKPLLETPYAGHLGAWNTFKTKLMLPYDQDQISFDFIGINQRNPKKVQYRWKLVGNDADWSPSSQKSDVTYSNLNPGEYSFQVIAMNEDGVWSETPATVEFFIDKPIWETWWFRALVIIALLLIIGLIFNLRVKQVKRATERERQTLTLEKNLLELEQKALRLQMNPHFIFNALNSIQGLIAKKDEKTARYQLAKFSKLMRLILENSRSSMIPLEAEIKALENYLTLERFSRNEAFDYQINTEADLETGTISIPPMLIQPFVENAIIHGVAHLEENGRIEVRFTMDGTYLLCTIEDNGIGRKKAKDLDSQKEHGHKSTALVVTQERLDLLNTKESKSTLEIIDLEDNQGNGVGTRVVIRIPAG